MKSGRLFRERLQAFLPTGAVSFLTYPTSWADKRRMSFLRRAGKMRLRGFTILELLVALSVLIMLLALILPLVSGVTRITSSNPPTFQEARTAFETMTRMLSQAVVNTYWDYDNPRTPEKYVRASELHFLLGPASTLTNLPATSGSAVFFQAPLGQNPGSIHMADLLNSVGFYTLFSTSEHVPPYLASTKAETAAWRLWMYLQPSANFAVYDSYNADPQASSKTTWFQADLTTPALNHVLANNVVLLLLRATYPNANDQLVERYTYDSRPAFTGPTQPIEMHQIPPVIHATLVVIDQQTADRLLAAKDGTQYDLIPDDLFQGDNASQYRNDLEKLKTHLNDRPISGIPIHYRIFEATISMNASQWSTN